MYWLFSFVLVFDQGTNQLSAKHWFLNWVTISRTGHLHRVCLSVRLSVCPVCSCWEKKEGRWSDLVCPPPPPGSHTPSQLTWMGYARGEAPPLEGWLQSKRHSTRIVIINSNRIFYQFTCIISNAFAIRWTNHKGKSTIQIGISASLSWIVSRLNIYLVSNKFTTILFLFNPFKKKTINKL